MGIEPSDITMPELKEEEKPQDGVYNGVPSFCTVSDSEICAFFEAPMTWGSQIFTWAWMKGGDGKDYVGTSWPGASAKYIGTADNGNKVFKWTSAKTTAPDMIIFSGGGNQTADLSFTNGGYYTKDGCQSVVTGIQDVHSDFSPANNRYYNLNGQQVEPNRPGIYIRNGRKYVIK